MNAEDPMETEESSTQNEQGTPMDHEQLVTIFAHCYFFMIYISLIYFYVHLQVEKLKELSKKPDIYEMLTRSLAPNIWELDDVKKGLLCQVYQVVII